MKNFDLAREIHKALEKAKKDSQNNTYILKPDTVKKIGILQKAFADTKTTISFDRVANSIEVSTIGYVFDSCTCQLKNAFETVDLFVIDALSDGRVCLEMKIIDAAEILRRN